MWYLLSLVFMCVSLCNIQDSAIYSFGIVAYNTVKAQNFVLVLISMWNYVVEFTKWKRFVCASRAQYIKGVLKAKQLHKFIWIAWVVIVLKNKTHKHIHIQKLNSISWKEQRRTFVFFLLCLFHSSSVHIILSI